MVNGKHLRLFCFISCATLLLVTAMASTGNALSLNMSATAKCLLGGNIVDEDGGPGFPVAHCDRQVNINNIVVKKNGTTTGDALAIAGFRNVGVSATASADLQTNLPENFGAVVTASAQVQDTFFMDAALPDGTPVGNGFMQINVVTQGSVSLTTGGSASSSLFSEANLNYVLTVGGFAVASNQVNLVPGDGPQIVTAVLAVTVPWQRGLAIPIFMTANASVDANLTFSGSVEARADFGHTMRWMGISNVTDADGNPVGSFTALSPEGGDWGTSSCPGDLDVDGDVDGSELAVLAAYFGRNDCDAPPQCEGDFDKDDDVDESDLDTLGTDLGRTDCP